MPAPVRGGLAPVDAGNTGWNPATERLEPRFGFPDKTDARVLPRGEGSAAENILAELWRHGRAAGNHGDLYDNRDRGHSRLDPAAHPQLSFVTYSEAARAADLDYGLNEHLTFDHPTFGNSSTAITGGALWRSLPRYAMTQADGTGPLRLWQNAATTSSTSIRRTRTTARRTATSSRPTPPISWSRAAPRAPTSPSSTPSR